jgi:ATP-dependent DNA helicase RecG
MDINDLMRLIRDGEGEKIEFKKKVSNVAETVSAMANAYGGFILIGIDNEGNLVGVGKKDLDRVSNALVSLQPTPALKTHSIKVDGKDILVLEVDKSEEIVSLGNRAYIRVGRSNRPLSIDEILQKGVELLKVKFDNLPSGAPIAALNKDYLRWYFEKRLKYRGIPQRGTELENLKRLKICVEKEGKLFPSFAGLLFFSDRPEEYLPDARLRIIELSGLETMSVKEFYGPVWRIADESFRYLIKSLKTLEFRVGVERRRILEYPEGVIREAIVNALVHRNYAYPADVRIFIKPREILIRSPGSFPPGISLDDPEHLPRNPLLAHYMYDTGYIEKYGFGIIKMREEAERHPLVKLMIIPAQNKVDVVLKKIREHPEMDEIDRKIYAMLNTPRRSSEITEEVGMSKVSILARLEKLISLGLVRKEGRGPGTRYIAHMKNKER